MKIRLLSLAPALLAFCGTALQNSTGAEVYFDTVSTTKAVRTHGAYFGLFGGGSSSMSTDIEKPLDDFSDEDGDGIMFGMEFGYEFTTPFPVRPAFEVEFAYLGNDFRAKNETSTARADMTTWTVMANFVLALDLRDYRDTIGDFAAGLHPYVGVGAGGAYTTGKRGNIETPGERNQGFDIGSGFSPAYQIFGGLEVDLGDYVSLYGEYRYLVVDDVNGEALGQMSQKLWLLGFKVKY